MHRTLQVQRMCAPQPSHALLDKCQQNLASWLEETGEQMTIIARAPERPATEQKTAPEHTQPDALRAIAAVIGPEKMAEALRRALN
ncbi:MAG: hypothetical protein DCC55_08625 [Chloroflexi bacterium]|nr:MAG: hypothetical protein DCC55_08625 [Chloroflexota bacterium]